MTGSFFRVQVRDPNGVWRTTGTFERAIDALLWLDSDGRILVPDIPEPRRIGAFKTLLAVPAAFFAGACLGWAVDRILAVHSIVALL